MSKLATACKKGIAAILMLIMLVSTMVAFPISAGADTTVSKQEKTYEIAVAFDNSGSMYDDERWCQAKYAMEIFASMLNYSNGDKLTIYTMNPVKEDVGGDGIKTPITVSSQGDIDKISKMYTLGSPNGTPLKPITSASKYLKSSSATDKWLIVLSDGQFNAGDNNETLTVTNEDLRNKLLNQLSGAVKVQYLGFGDAVDIKGDEAKGFYAKKTTADSLMNDLINVCNRIFQRSELPADRLSGKALNLDLSMKNIIVFVQGPDARINSLKDKDGAEIIPTLDSGQRKYSTIASTLLSNPPADKYLDKSLSGQVVTFSDCSTGKYTLDYANSKSINIYYEPDVDISVTLTNSDGQIIDGSTDNIPAGEYTVTSAIVDNATGEDVTKHQLMGDVSLKTYYKSADAGDYSEATDGKITLEPDASTDILVKGQYLEIYEISSKDNSDLDWLSGIKAIKPAYDVKVDAKVLQSQSWYETRKHDSWEPIKATVTIDGQPCTDEQLDSTKLTITPSKELIYYYEPIKGESAFNIYIGHDKDGKYTEPETGKYKLTITATYTDENQKEASGTDKVSFDIQWYSKIWQWLVWIVLLIVLIIIILIILNRPALPAQVYMDIPRARACNLVRLSGNSLMLSTNTYPGELRCEAKACTPLRIRKKRIAKFQIKNLRAMGGVTWYEINGTRYKLGNGGRFVDDDGKTIDQARPLKTVGNGTEIVWKASTGTRTGYIKINNR